MAIVTNLRVYLLLIIDLCYKYKNNNTYGCIFKAYLGSFSFLGIKVPQCQRIPLYNCSYIVNT